ncbi:uncharacterized protein LOC129767075 [Toxorhynchites rutilus septentrionalis]|uniref:uncharacterized protein LOC129767075 n=1 Tax=Toxorhynchites rutilus septentrionalis TaxID=329112 RepID=UPI00247A29CB|nr:uncharacterized protein LOC129767075 [Toxorhynchites rutilus septentrionalis]
MAEKKMKKKELQRNNLVDSIYRIKEFLRNYTEQQINEVKIRLERLDKLMEAFEEVQTEYETYDDTAEFIVENTKLRAEIEEEYYRVKGGLTSKIPLQVPNAAAVMQVVPAIAQAAHIKLPTITLPNFDGDLNSWLTFHDSFSSLIHSSADIPCIQKFQYLPSALRGDALKLIGSLTITSDNYAIAWEALNKRYANKYLLKKKHLQALTSSTKLTAKTVSNLRSLLEDFERNVKILTQLGEPTEQWSSILVQLLSSQLDDGTLKDWEEHVSGENEPTYENLVKFLTMKVRTLDSLSINAEQNPSSLHSRSIIPKQQKPASSPHIPRINTYTITDSYQPDCLACSDKHFLVKCPVFDKMHLKDKLNLVNSKRICSNCFRGNHFVRKCTSKYSCRICQKKHHTSLHPGFEANSSSNPNT